MHLPAAGRYGRWLITTMYCVEPLHSLYTRRPGCNYERTKSFSPSIFSLFLVCVYRMWMCAPFRDLARSLYVYETHSHSISFISTEHTFAIRRRVEPTLWLRSTTITFVSLEALLHWKQCALVVQLKLQIAFSFAEDVDERGEREVK